MSKNRSKLFSAVAMLVIAAIAVTSASYAWFTMSKEVSATGLSLTAQAPTSLKIAVDTQDTYDQTATFSSIESPFVPVSGDYSAPTFFYATKNDSNVPLSTEPFSENIAFASIPGAHTTNRTYYVDIPLWIKAPDLDNTLNIDLYVKSLTINETSATTLNKAYKVAIIQGGTVKGVYSTSAGTWTPLQTATTLAESAVSPTAQGVGSGKTVIGTITAQDTPVAFTLRVWLEGQDTDCIMDNAQATGVSASILFEGVDVPKA